MASSSVDSDRHRAARRRTRLLAAAASVVALVGCGSSSEFPVAAATGEFVLDGKPLGVGRVMLSPIAPDDGSMKAGRPAFGDLDADGRFVLSTYGDGDGAVVGKHRVNWINTQSKTDAGKTLGVARTTYPMPVTVVADGENHFRLEMSRADLRKYGRSLD